MRTELRVQQVVVLLSTLGLLRMSPVLCATRKVFQTDTCVPGSAWDVVLEASHRYPTSFWTDALKTVGLNMLLEMEGQPASTLFIPVDTSLVNGSTGDWMEVGRQTTFLRSYLTSPESAGQLLFHWVQDNRTLLNRFFTPDTTDFPLPIVNGNESKVSMAPSAISDSSQARDILGTVAGCDGSTVHVISSVLDYAVLPEVDLAKIPGLEGLCWKSRAVVDSHALNGPSTGSLYLPYIYLQILLVSKFPAFQGTLNTQQPASNVTFLAPDPDHALILLDQLVGLPSEELGRAATLYGQYVIPGGYCREGLLAAGTITTYGGLSSGTDLTVTFEPGADDAEIYITMPGSDRVISAWFVPPACFSTALVMNDTLVSWENWTDIPVSDVEPWPQVYQPDMFWVEEECRADADRVLRAVPAGWLGPGVWREEDSSSSLSGGAIAGIVLGSVAATLLLGALGWFVVLPHIRRSNTEWNEIASTQNTSSGSGTQIGAELAQVSTTPASLSPEAMSFRHVWLQPTDFTFDVNPATGERQLLGQGRFGKVYSGKLKNQEGVAIKMWMGVSQNGTLSPDLEARLLQEIQILKSCRSRYIVNFVGIVFNSAEGHILLVMELAPGGDVWSALRSGGMTWRKQGWHIALDVARGLVYLATKRIVHNDLKSSNILLDDYGEAKITDVGLARLLPDPTFASKKEVMHAGGGSFNWCAPEAILGLQTTEKSDMYSFGVVLWELITNEVPVRSRMRPVRTPEECPEEVAALMEACWDPDPENRPRAEDAVKVLSRLYETPGDAGNGVGLLGNGTAPHS